jgi:YfiH family protein
MTHEPAFLVPDWNAPKHVIARVTTRAAGYSKPPFDSLNLALHVGDRGLDVQANRRAVANALGGELRWQWLDQVHGASVERIEAASAPRVADALVTSVPGLVCCVLTADCLSVFFTDAEGREVAVAHAGWRGLAAGILEGSVRSLSAPPERVLAWIGPAIGPCHFEVGEEVRSAFLESADSLTESRLAACFKPGTASGKFNADLFALARVKLSAMGVAAIGGGDTCTVCEAQSYYSYRRDQTTGRHLSLIYLAP